jgi:hypothetical protein
VGERLQVILDNRNRFEFTGGADPNGLQPPAGTSVREGSVVRIVTQPAKVVVNFDPNLLVLHNWVHVR